MIYDIAIIGAGIAGLTAAIYARRAAKTVIIFEKESIGGQIALSANVENYPGIAAIAGAELAENLMNQALNLDAVLELDEVVSVAKNAAGIFEIKTEFGEYTAKAVIIATGLRHRKPVAEGVDRFDGNGVSYCAVCDGAFYRGRDVAVIGGGNTALQEAIYLSDMCKTVYVVHRRDAYRAEKAVIDLFLSKQNIVRVENALLKSINGENHIESITVEDAKNGTLKQYAVDGVFAALGHVPANSIFEGLTMLDPQGFIVANESCITDAAGLFVAGDCRTKAVRQLTTAASDGAIAAVTASKYIDNMA